MSARPSKITKASGEKAPYSEAKLLRSIEGAGVDTGAETEIFESVASDLVEDTTTQEIFKKTYERLKRHSGPSAGRYKLKRAIMELGPSGYPFERFFSSILQDLGFRTKVGVIVSGHCVNHEVDVVAERDNQVYMVECKFRNRPGYKSDVKIPLYIHSRFKDVEKKWKRQKENQGKDCQGWVVTNAAFTTDAIQYGVCANLKMTGWNYPPKGSLREVIEQRGLYPVTCLTGLTKFHIRHLLEHNIIMARDLVEQEKIRESLELKRGSRKLLREIHDLCGEAAQHEPLL